MEDLKGKAVRGGFVKIWTQAAIFVIRAGSLMILARLLDPKDFGLVAMVTAVTGILVLFRDAGLSTATVQRTTITDRQISTMFWINLGIGGLLTVLSLALAPILGAFYHEPKLVWITVALAAAFLVNGAGVQHSALLNRQMRFTTLAAIDLAALFAGAAVGIGMAMLGFGYWALVGMAITPTFVGTVCLWLAAAWVPGPPRRVAEVRSLLKFGGMVTLNSLVVYIAYNTEKVLLGRFWGTEMLGIYGRAYQLINVPTRNLNSAIGGVAYAALSRLQNDPSRFKSYFLRGYSLVLSMTFPMTIAAALFANDLVLIFLGPKWKEAVVLLRLLAPTLLAFALIDPFGWLLVATGRVVRSLKIALVIAPLVLGAYLAGLRYGPRGVAFGYSAMMMFLSFPVIAWSKSGTSITWGDIWKAIRAPVLSSIVAAAFGLAAQLWITPKFAPLFRLVLNSGAMIAAYLGTLFYVVGQKVFYMDLLREVLKRPPRRGQLKD
jgi:O-antigen/teichoic acid export membrane protein